MTTIPIIGSTAAYSALVTTAALLSLFFIAGPLKAQARPGQTARSYCKAHPNYGGPGEQSEEELPPDVRSSGRGSLYWRCKSGQVWVCAGGLSGFDCAQTAPVDAERMRALREFCARFPGTNYIGRSLTMGLASSWRCNGRTPAQTTRIPVDAAGFILGKWRPLR
jgi:hypothetical protein